ncbi:MAG: hypothetical protein M3P42_02485 [Actinomycetota bacterium]|nr:hypothetical protein [Actinomycetota bacterium]
MNGPAARVLTFGGVLAALFASAELTRSAPGDRDRGFGRRGALLTDVGGRSDDRCFELAIQRDGKVVCVGVTVARGSQSEDVLVARYLSDGRRDLAFGSGGILRFDSGLSRDDVATTGLIQRDGKIVIAGVSDVAVGQDVLVARFRPDGSRDATFGRGGFVTSDIGGGAGDFDYAFAVALQPDGKIVVAGQTATGTNSDVAVGRYTAQGALDATFGARGKVRVDFGGVDAAYAVLVLPGGKILVGATAPRGNEEFGLLRLLPNGRRDRTFGRDGLAGIDVGNVDADLRALVRLPSGKLVAVGTGFDEARNYSALAGTRADGRLDRRFGRQGRLILKAPGPPGESGAFAAAAMPSGKFVIAGGIGGRIFVSRHLPDGRHDPSFGGTGLVATRIASGAGWASAVAVQPDDAVVAAGSWARRGNHDLAVLRLRGRGTRGTTITSLNVGAIRAGRVVRWRTSSEAKTARFEVYREGSGGLVPVYPRPVGVGGPRRGGAYSVSDGYRLPAELQLVYWLIEVKNDGRRITYGPIVG